MAVSLKTDLRFPISGQWGHGDRIIQERLQKRQELIKPMVEEFFAWVKQQVSDCTVPPKSKTGQGLNFVINQEKYRKRTIASTP